MKYSIRGFGANKPIFKWADAWENGIEMAQSNDRGYAIDIAKCLAEKYSAEQQIFGVVDNTGVVIGAWHAQGLKEIRRETL